MYSDIFIQKCKRVIIAVAGADRSSFNHAFTDNIKTFIYENPDDTVHVIQGWTFYNNNELMNAIINMSHKVGGIDSLVIESHATSNVLSIIPRTDTGARLWLTPSDNWGGINFHEHANIRFTGCNAGGNNGIASPSSIAQQVANQTQRIVLAFVNNTSQIGRDAPGNIVGDWRKASSFRQEPVQMFWMQKVVRHYTRFCPAMPLKESL